MDQHVFVVGEADEETDDFGFFAPLTVRPTPTPQPMELHSAEDCRWAQRVLDNEMDPDVAELYCDEIFPCVNCFPLRPLQINKCT